MARGDTFSDRLNRRRFMRLAGGAGALGLSGCLSQEDLQDGGGGGGGGSDDTTTESGGGGGDDSDSDDDSEETTEEQKDPLKVGVTIPFSGDLSDFGGPMLNALKMAQEDINAAGGPLGRKIELLDEDTGTDSTQGVNGANKLVDTDDVNAIFGAVSSGVTISIAKSVTIPKQRIHITPASSSPSITTLDDDDYVWRTRTNDRFVAKVMANIISNQGGSKAAVIYINNDFGLALADTFESNFSGTTTAKVGYESGQSSYQQVLSKAFEDDPDFIAFAGYPESGTTMLTQWHEGGYGGNWVLHTSLLSNDVIQNVGADVMNGMFGVRTKPPTGDDTEAFVSDYEETYPDAQVFDPYSWNSYDALVSYALAVQKAGTATSSEVKKHLRDVATPPGEGVGYTEFGDGKSKLESGTAIDYSGPSGNVNYDENGDVASDMVVVGVEDGEFTNQRTIPAEDLV